MASEDNSHVEDIISAATDETPAGCESATRRPLSDDDAGTTQSTVDLAENEDDCSAVVDISEANKVRSGLPDPVENVCVLLTLSLVSCVAIETS